jgi:hypothetical protein
MTLARMRASRLGVIQGIDSLEVGRLADVLLEQELVPRPVDHEYPIAGLGELGDARVDDHVATPPVVHLARADGVGRRAHLRQDHVVVVLRDGLR